MVAVGITVLMLMATSVVFKSAGAAAGKANACSEIMQQVRALCRQLENDFKGLRPDMPMAVIFETEDPTDSTSPRQDRIVFFANGDFQTTDGDSGNLARIFYGQAREGIETPEHLDNPSAPWRRVLTRRYKIMSPFGYPPANDVSWNGDALWPGWKTYSPEGYDDELLENSNESYWKTEDPQNFVDYHFRTWDGPPPDFPPSPSGPVNTGWRCSMVRRPEIELIKNNLGADALQQLYMLPDVSDFRIEFWGQPPPGSWRWFPSSTELYSFCQTPNPPTAGGQLRGYTFYWNAPKLLPPLLPPPLDYMSDKDGFRWFWLNVNAGQTPKAIRFTFTLYDRDRRYYPDGRTFTYIVKLPRR